MNCPSCNITLLLSEKQGISIDYCPQCRGIWLEKGKLEKIIDKMSSAVYPNNNNNGYMSDSHHSNSHDDHYSHDGHRKKHGLFGFFD